MNEKQITFLTEFEKEMRTSPMDAMLIKSKYVNGDEILTMFAMDFDKWIELVSLGDTDDLWQNCNKYLEKLSC